MNGAGASARRTEPWVYRSHARRGWLVVIHREGRPVHSKLFSDDTYGGTEAAFEIAVDFRDSVVRRWGLPAPTPKGKRSPACQVIPRRDSRSGVAGVYRSGQGTGGHWVAAWTKHGKRRTKHFSVARHGEAEAFALAVAWRRDREVELPREATQDSQGAFEPGLTSERGRGGGVV